MITRMLYQGTPLDYSAKALKRYRRHIQLVLQDPGGALTPRVRSILIRRRCCP